jgi:hypothetical protein
LKSEEKSRGLDQVRLDRGRAVREGFLEQLQFTRNIGGFCAIVDAEFVVDALDWDLDRIGGDGPFMRDLVIEKTKLSERRRLGQWAISTHAR